MEAWRFKVNALRRLESSAIWAFLPYQKRRRQKTRETSWHVLRHDRYNFLQIIVDEKLGSKRRLDRRQMTWLRNLRKWSWLELQSLIRKVPGHTIICRCQCKPSLKKKNMEFCKLDSEWECFPLFTSFHTGRRKENSSSD